MRVDPRHRRAALIAAGGAAIVLAVGLALAPGEEEAGSAVELVAAPPPAAPPEAAPSPVAQAASAPAPTPASLEGLRLHGLLSGGAVIALAGGGQKLVRLGREVLPGVTLAEVRQDRVMLAQGDRMVELGFGSEAASPGLAAEAAGQGSAPAATATAVAAPAAGDARRQALEYRLGLAPRQVGGRTVGFALRPGASLPMLQRAGLRPGDLILSVNGQAFDSEEKVLELPQEIAGSYTAVFEFERGGRRMTASLPVNPRP